MRKKYCISISWFSILITLFLGIGNPSAFPTDKTNECPNNFSEPTCEPVATCCCVATIEADACCDAPDQSLVFHNGKCTCHVITKSNQPVPQARYSSLSHSTEKQKESSHILNGYSPDGISNQNNICISCSNHTIPCPSTCIAKVRLRL
jgi:hypothetical protein